MPLRIAIDRGDPAALAAALLAAWRRDEGIALAEPQDRDALREALHGPPEDRQPPLDPRRFGPAVVLGSGGTSGGRRWCLQPLGHLQASAAATGRWLTALGIDPSACLHLSPLPLRHVSGLLPLVRTRQWQARLRWLPAAWMKDPGRLAAAVPLPRDHPVLLSLVPTQLERLLGHEDGRRWLAGCAVIWVGGAALPADLAARARRAGLPLAPCYGSTETAAMVCAQPAGSFLTGVEGCGPPLDDVRLRIDPATAAVEVRLGRLSPGHFEAGRLLSLPRSVDGWWRSGDAGLLGPDGLRLTGRRDGAVSSGGETVFPEQVEERLRRWIRRDGLAVADLLLLPEPDRLWGHRLVGLFRPGPGSAGSERLAEELTALAAALPPSQRPRSWLPCPELARDPLGKWRRGHWREWLQTRGMEGSR